MDANERQYLVTLSNALREAIGNGTGKRERKVLKVAKALEEVAQ